MTPAEQNRANFPELAKCVDDLRKLGFIVKLEWAINAEGVALGPVPQPYREKWDQ